MESVVAEGHLLDGRRDNELQLAEIHGRNEWGKGDDPVLDRRQRRREDGGRAGVSGVLCPSLRELFHRTERERVGTEIVAFPPNSRARPAIDESIVM